MTIAMFLATVAYFVACLAGLAGAPVPFEVYVWGGMVLILGWYVHDTYHERKVA